MGAKNTEPTDVLYRMKRGLASYVSYLAACEMNEAFSEYVLYEPILRILTARNYTVKCEYKCPGIQHAAQGDKKRIDFRATRDDPELELAIEVKWVKSVKANVTGDLVKLAAFLAARPNSVPLLVLFGRKSILEEVDLSTSLAKLEFEEDRLKERGKARIADLGKTRFGCRIFELKAA